MEKEKKKISCSYAVLVIILFAALAFVTDYAIIERKMIKCNCPKCEVTTNNEEKEEPIINNENSNEQVNEVNNDDSISNSTVRHFEYYVQGETEEWYDFVKYSLDLYDDGTFGLYIYNEYLPEYFKFMHWKEFFWNYDISGDNLKLDYLYYIINNGGMYWHTQGTSNFNISGDIVTGILNYSNKKDENIVFTLKEKKLEYNEYNSMNDVLKNFTLAE